MTEAEKQEELTYWKVRLVHDEADMVRFQHRFASALSGDEVISQAEFDGYVREHRHFAENIECCKARIAVLEA